MRCRFAPTFGQENDQNACFPTKRAILEKHFEKSPVDIAKDCASQLSESSRCIQSVAR